MLSNVSEKDTKLFKVFMRWVFFFQVNEDTKQQKRKGNKQLLLENIDYALDMFLIFALTLSIFPGFLSEDTGSHSLGTWYVH